MSGRPVCIWLIAVSLFLTFSIPTFAQEEPIYFQSDYQQEIQDEEVLILQGNVEVHFRENIIYADEVRLNDEKDEFFAVGNVRVVTPDRDMFGDSIWYNYARDEFDMRNVRGSMIASGVSELVWFEAERLKGDVNDFKMINGTVTTCTPDERREYHIEAHSIKVLKDNKVIVRNGYFFILNVPILWFPYWAYSLAETPWEIQAGKNFDGVFVKTRYNYLAEELIVGSILTEYYSRRGYRLGSEHSYVLPSHGQGSFRWSFLYGTFRDTNGEVIHANTYNVNTQQAIRFGTRFSGNIRLTANSSFNIQRGRTNDVNGTVSASYNESDVRTSFNLTLRRQSGASQSSNISASVQQNRTIFNDVTSSIKLDYTVNKPENSGAADEEFNTHVEFRQNQQGWNWNAIVDSHWDPDGFLNISDRNRRYTDRLPEINVTLQPSVFPNTYRNLLGFTMSQVNAVGALYYIGPENNEVNGFYGRFDTRFTRSDDLGASHRMQTTLNYWQAIASTGDARYVFGSQVNWNWTISKKIKWQLGWDRTDSEGRIPFQGRDNPSNPQNRLSWSLNYQNGRLYTIRMSTSYDLREKSQLAPGEVLQIKRLADLQFSLNYTPSRKTTVTLSTAYNFGRGELGNIRSTINTTDNRSYRIQSSINLNRKLSLTSWSTRASFIIGSDWDFEVETDFAPTATDIVRNIKVTHRLDCTFLDFQYRATSDEWFITWGITAYPRAALNYPALDTAFGPDFFNQFSGGGSGFGLGGSQFGGSGGFGSGF